MGKRAKVLAGGATAVIAAALATAPLVAHATEVSATEVPAAIKLKGGLNGGGDAGDNDVEVNPVVKVLGRSTLLTPMGTPIDVQQVKGAKVPVEYADGTTGTVTPSWDTDGLDDASRYAQPGKIVVQGTVKGAVVHNGVTMAIMFDAFLTINVTPTPSYFTDVPASHWAVREGWLDYALGHGLMGGYGTSFAPDATLTRGQVAAVLYRIANPGSDATTNPEHYGSDTGFKDGGSQRYYFAAVKWLKGQGISTGDKDAAGNSLNTFRPDANITRQELAAMVHRFAQRMGADASGADASALDRFRDAGQVQPYARQAMAWCNERGVITGGQGAAAGLLMPGQNATRAQAAKIFTVVHRDVLGK